MPPFLCARSTISRFTTSTNSRVSCGTVPLDSGQSLPGADFRNDRGIELEAVKVVGGMEYSYAMRGDGQFPTRKVPSARQRRALEVLLSLLDPRELDLPDAIVELFQGVTQADIIVVLGASYEG